MYFPENMTAAYFFFDTYPGYFLQALPIALLAGGLWAFRLRKTALPCRNGCGRCSLPATSPGYSA